MNKLQAIVEAIIVLTIMWFFYGFIKVCLMAYDFFI
jgi:hypothetical protein